MKNKGFTLVEIMIVVAIIALLAAIAIPNLLRARVSAEESAAASAMHTISAAMVQWRASNPQYAANIAALSGTTPPYIDNTLGGGTKQGYVYTAAAEAGNEASQFTATAVPVTITQSHSYYIDENGVLYRSTAVNQAAAAHTTGAPADYAEVQ